MNRLEFISPKTLWYQMGAGRGNQRKIKSVESYESSEGEIISKGDWVTFSTICKGERVEVLGDVANILTISFDTGYPLAFFSVNVESGCVLIDASRVRKKSTLLLRLKHHKQMSDGRLQNR